MTEQTENTKNITSQWLDWQRAFWNDWMSTASKGVEGPKSTGPNNIPLGVYNDMYQSWLKSVVNPIFENENYGGLGAGVFNSLTNASTTYISILEFLGRSMPLLGQIPTGTTLTADKIREIYNQWNEEYQSVMTSLWGAFIPVGLKETAEVYQNKTGNINEYIWQFWEVVQKNIELLPDLLTRINKGEIGAGVELTGLLRKNYEATLGKQLRAPSLGYYREFNDKMNRVIDAYIQYNTVLSEYFLPFYQTGQHASEELFKRITEYQGKEVTAETLQEFYRTWWTVNEEAYYQMFQSEEFTKLLGDMLHQGLLLRKYFDELTDEVIKFTNLPTKKDMDDVYRAIYELKKEIRKQKKTIHQLEQQVNE